MRFCFEIFDCDVSVGQLFGDIGLTPRRQEAQSCRFGGQQLGAQF